MYRVLAVTVAVLPMLGGTFVTAQRLAPRLRPARDSVGVANNSGAMVVAGLTAGAIGFFVGGYAGAALGGGNRTCGDDPCGLESALWGATAGVSTFIPLGVHLANHGRGNYGSELAASVIVGIVGLGFTYSSNDARALLLVPLGQLVTSVVIERATSRR
jgi:hypothetical protein